MLHPKGICVHYKHVGNFEELSHINPSSVKQGHSPQGRAMHTDNPLALAQVFSMHLYTTHYHTRSHNCSVTFGSNQYYLLKDK